MTTRIAPYFFLFLSFSLVAQENDSTLVRLQKKLQLSSNSAEKVKALYELGEYQIEFDLKIAEDYLEEARKLAEAENAEPKHLAYTYNQLGVVNRRKGAYGEAISLYLKSKDIYEKLKDTSNVADVIHNIGIVYRYQEQDSIAAQHFKTAIGLNSKVKDTFGLAAAHNMLGVQYRRMNKLDSALVNYHKAKHLFKLLDKKEDIRRVNSNLAVVYSKRGEHEKSLPIKLTNLEYNKERGKKMSVCVGYFSLSKEYSRLGMPEKAKKYADSSLQIALAEGYKERISSAYVRRSAVHRDLKNFKQAYTDYRLYKRYSDSLYGLQSAERIKELELQYQLEKDKEELEILSEERDDKLRLYLFLFILAVVIGVIVGYLLWRNYAARMRITAEKLEKSKLKRALLDEKMKVSEAELKYLVADNTMRLQFVKELSKQIKKDKKEAFSKDIQQYTQKLILRLQQQIATEHKLSSLQEKMEKVNRGFDKKLIQLFPDLTKTEREVCALSRLNLSIKEIASTRNTTTDAIKSVRYRIRKKLQIPREVELEKYIQGL